MLIKRNSLACSQSPNLAACDGVYATTAFPRRTPTNLELPPFASDILMRKTLRGLRAAEASTADGAAAAGVGTVGEAAGLTIIEVRL